MALRRLFKSGSAVVVAIPREWREALGLAPGVVVTMGLRDKRITLERAIVTGAGLPDPQAPADKPSHD